MSHAICRASLGVGLVATLFWAGARHADAQPMPPPQSVPIPPVNLGGSAFADAAGGPGVFARAQVAWGQAPHFLDGNGQPIPGNHSVAVVLSIAHVGFALPYRFLGGFWGADALLPVPQVTLTNDGQSATATGLGDLIASPLVVQWPSLRLSSRQRLFQRLSLTLIFPTGSYDPTARVNIGSNVFSINPYYTFTLFLTQRLETSWRIQYLWNSANHAPEVRFGTDQVQPGQAVHFNCALSYAILPTVRVGVAGYFLAQTTDSLIGGQPIPGVRERVAALGPGLGLSLGLFRIDLNTFWEFAVENRPSGFRATMTVMYIWPLGGRPPAGGPPPETGPTPPRPVGL